MILLGLDFGKKRVGTAISHGIVAQSHATIDFDEAKFELFLLKIKKIIAEQKVDKVVIGIPLGRDGKETSQGIWTEKQADRLKGALEVPVVFVEESFSSAEALSQISEFAISKKRKRQKGLIDMESARIILHQYLNEDASSSL